MIGEGISLESEEAGGDTADRLARIEQMLREIGDRTAVAQPRWLTLQIASGYCSLSIDSLRQLVSSGRLTPRRAVRGRILIDRMELDNLIASSTARIRGGRGSHR